MMNNPHRRAFAQARRDIAELISGPLARWQQLPRHKRTPAAYAPLFSIPLDMASAGWKVTISEDERGWSIGATRKIAEGIVIELEGVNPHLYVAWFRLADSAAGTIDIAQRRAREKAAKTARMQESEAA
jgi:hypothetical protein